MKREFYLDTSWLKFQIIRTREKIPQAYIQTNPICCKQRDKIRLVSDFSDVLKARK